MLTDNDYEIIEWLQNEYSKWRDNDNKFHSDTTFDVFTFLLEKGYINISTLDLPKQNCTDIPTLEILIDLSLKYKDLDLFTSLTNQLKEVHKQTDLINVNVKQL